MKRLVLVALIPVAALWVGATMAFAQAVQPIDVKFKMLDMSDPYAFSETPLPGAKVRLVLGKSPNWQDAGAGCTFGTDARGEARFVMEGLIDKQWQSRNIGFTPFSWPSRAEHVFVAVELDHEFSFVKGRKPEVLRWLLTMDVYCFADGQCSTVGFMTIFARDAAGRFTRALERQGGEDAWKVPELNNRVIWGMSYKVANFGFEAAEGNPRKRTFVLTLKRFLRRPLE